MVGTPRVEIAPAVLRWATERTGLSDGDLERIFPKLAEWFEGETQPTLRQAQELAQRARIPFGRLLLEEPTGENTGIADFRTIRNSPIGKMSPDLREVVLKSQQRLAWYAEYSKAEGLAAPRLLASANLDDDPALVAKETRKDMGFGESSIGGPDRVRNVVQAMEEAGILVSRNSVVESSTKRKLDVKEFRGFTIEDDGYCLVYINTRDTKTAQLFSLAHEMAHVVLGKPGVSDHSDSLGLEKWCNRFASEFIAPPNQVKAAHDFGKSILENVDYLSPRFGLSREAMLWRLVELDLRSRDEAVSILPVLRSNAPNTQNEAGGAPPYHVMVRSRVGGRFYDTVTLAAENRQISDQEAARLLTAKTYQSFKELVSARQNFGQEFD